VLDSSSTYDLKLPEQDDEREAMIVRTKYLLGGFKD
jgi:hypothetical protein